MAVHISLFLASWHVGIFAQQGVWEGKGRCIALARYGRSAMHWRCSDLSMKVPPVICVARRANLPLYLPIPSDDPTYRGFDLAKPRCTG